MRIPKTGSKKYYAMLEEVSLRFGDESMTPGEQFWCVDFQPVFDNPSCATYAENFRRTGKGFLLVDNRRTQKRIFA